MKKSYFFLIIGGLAAIVAMIAIRGWSLNRPDSREDAKVSIATSDKIIAPVFPYGFEPVSALVTWNDEVDLSLAAKAPKFVTNAVAWDQLWTIWKPNNTIPFVDFEKAIVLIGCTHDDCNRISNSSFVDKDGDLRISFMQTLLDCPPRIKSRYQFAIILRNGIKSIEGVPLIKNAP